MTDNIVLGELISWVRLVPFVIIILLIGVGIFRALRTDPGIQNKMDTLAHEISLVEENGKRLNVPHKFNIAEYSKKDSIIGIGMYKICEKDENPPRCMHGSSYVCFVKDMAKTDYCSRIEKGFFAKTSVLTLTEPTIDIEKEQNIITLSN